MGNDITMADFFAYYTLSNGRIIAKKTWGWDLVANIPRLRFRMAVFRGTIELRE
jgi:glutathione S-transferase